MCACRHTCTHWICQLQIQSSMSVLVLTIRNCIRPLCLSFVQLIVLLKVEKCYARLIHPVSCAFLTDKWQRLEKACRSHCFA